MVLETNITMSNLQIISIWWKVWRFKVFFLCFLLLKACVTELFPSDCSYKVCAKGRNAFCRARQRLAEQERALFHTERRAVPLPALDFNELQPNWTTIAFFICEQHAITNRCEICSLLFGHFWAQTQPPHGKIAQWLYGCAKFSGCSCEIRHTNVIPAQPAESQLGCLQSIYMPTSS